MIISRGTIATTAPHEAAPWMSSGEAWVKCTALPLDELKAIARRPGFHVEEETARFVLSARLVFERTTPSIEAYECRLDEAAYEPILEVAE